MARIREGELRCPCCRKNVTRLHGCKYRRPTQQWECDDCKKEDQVKDLIEYRVTIPGQPDLTRVHEWISEEQALVEYGRKIWPLMKRGEWFGVQVVARRCGEYGW